MTRRATRALVASVVCAALGCAPTQTAQTPEPADATVYEQHVQPYTAVTCATLDCHGDPGRPLRMYSEHGLRADAGLRSVAVAESRAAQPLTAAELRDNVTSFSSVSPLSDGPRHLALLKPLAGGVHHVGGELWPSEDAPGYLCLKGWLAPDPAAPEDTGQACAAALDALGF